MLVLGFANNRHHSMAIAKKARWVVLARQQVRQPLALQSVQAWLAALLRLWVRWAQGLGLQWRLAAALQLQAL